MPAVLFPKLEFFDFNKNSLYEVLKTFYDLSICQNNNIKGNRLWCVPVYLITDLPFDSGSAK